jgi:hypothetical protein
MLTGELILERGNSSPLSDLREGDPGPIAILAFLSFCEILVGTRQRILSMDAHR